MPKMSVVVEIGARRNYPIDKARFDQRINADVPRPRALKRR